MYVVCVLCVVCCMLCVCVLYACVRLCFYPDKQIMIPLAKVNMVSSDEVLSTPLIRYLRLLDIEEKLQFMGTRVSPSSQIFVRM